MRNWARDQHAFLFSDFKDAFKSNWKQALGVSLITAVVPVIAYTAVSYYGGMAGSNALMFLPMIVVLSAVLIYVIMLPLLYPMMVGYELSFKNLLRNAFLMSCARLPHMLLARMITLIPIFILAVGVLTGSGVAILGVSLYYLLFGFALSRLVYASFANSVFDRYLNPHIEGAVVRQGLRPVDADEALLDEEDEEDEEEE